MDQKTHIEKNTVQETLVIPLYGRKLCTEQFPNLFRDEKAVELIERIDYDFSSLEEKSKSFAHRFGALEVAMRESDLMIEAKDYLESHPYAVLVNLVTAKQFSSLYFLGGTYLILLVTGFHKACFRIIIPVLIFSSFFGVLTYLINQSVPSAVSMVSRLLAIGIAAIPGMSIRPIDLTRNMNQINIPRSVTLGMLIALNFTPLLSREIRQIREAMKTRGAGSVINFKILYRAFLIPLVMRLVNISDTLSLSVETRGFTLSGKDYSVYKTVKPSLKDFIILLAVVICAVTAVIL